MLSLQKTDPACYVPLSVSSRVCDAVRKTMCKFGDECLYKHTCIYAHPDNSTTRRRQACIYHLCGECRFADNCRFEHVVTADERKSIQSKLAERDCDYGSNCPYGPSCLFRHRQHLRLDCVIVNKGKTKRKKWTQHSK